MKPKTHRKRVRHYTWCIDEGDWSPVYHRTVKGALADATEHCGDGTYLIEIGECAEAPPLDIIVEDVLKDLQSNTDDTYGYLAGDYFDEISKYEKAELEVLLNKVYLKWAKKYKHLPSVYRVTTIALYRYDVGKSSRVGGGK